MAPHVSEYAVSRVEQRECGTAHSAAEQADSVSYIRTGLCGAIEERTHERLVGLEQFRRRCRTAL
eukprot:1050482-Pleurochrysis_carterae.AAC.1